MGTNWVVVRGSVRPDGTLDVSEKVSLTPGPVRVTIEALPALPASGPTVLEVLDRIHREQAARGYRGRTKEEIDASLNALREEWEERLRELEQPPEGGG